MYECMICGRHLHHNDNLPESSDDGLSCCEDCEIPFGFEVRSGDKVKIIDTFLFVYEKIVNYTSPFDCDVGTGRKFIYFTDGTSLQPDDNIVSYEVL